jgi:hypothetical protein
MNKGQQRIEDLLDPHEARLIYAEPQHEGYWIAEGKIVKVYSRLWVNNPSPLVERDFFVSFARLGARGDPTEAKIKKWVSKYGLPEVKVRRGSDDYERVQVGSQTRRQASMTVTEFKHQVQNARQFLFLYAEIARHETDKIRSRIDEPKSRLDWEVRRKFKSPDQRVLTATSVEGGWRMDKRALCAALPVLVENVREYVPDLRIRPEVFLDDVWQSYECPNLLSALYLQFWLMILNRLPMRYCDYEKCSTPFPCGRSDNEICSATCRSNKRYVPKKS